MKDVIIIIGISLGILMSVITLVKMVYGQGKARAREEGFLENLEKRDVEIKDNMNNLRNDIGSLSLKIDKSVLVQTDFANNMQGRVSRIEGILNGKIK